MNPYRFVGTACVVGAIEFDQFGQRAQFSDAQFREVVLGGGSFIPEADFQALEVTQEEIDTFGLGGGFPEPTADFSAKRDRAHQQVRDLIAEFTNAPAKGTGE